MIVNISIKLNTKVQNPLSLRVFAFFQRYDKTFININCDFVTKCVDSGMSVSPPQCKYCAFYLIGNENAWIEYSLRAKILAKTIH